MTSLADVPVGATARLVRLRGDRAFRRRLMELGLLPGTQLQVLRHAPLGAVIELDVRGSCLGLRTSQAREIEVANVMRAGVST